MINECEEHGYFRRDKCPVCGRNGKFVMSDFEVEKLGRMMAAILRHGKFSLEMTPQGFVKIQDIVDTMKAHNSRVKWLRPFHIDALALTDPKGRYQIKGQSVRATYGHTIKLDLNLPTSNIPRYLYYPASEEEADIIIDVRFLPNPYWNPEMRPLTGRDALVRDFVIDHPQTQAFLERWYALLDTVLPGYVGEGKSRLSVGIGCSGGQHRSVAIADQTALHLTKAGYHVLSSHRDLARAERRA